MKTDHIADDCEIRFSLTAQLTDIEEDYDLLHEFNGSIVRVRRDKVLKEEVVGRIHGVKVDLGGACNRQSSIHDLMDTTHEVEEYYGSLFDHKTSDFREDLEIDSPGDLLIIHTIKVNPKYRGQGLGLYAMRRTIMVWGGGCAVAAIKPFPMQFQGKVNDKNKEKFLAAQNKLRDYWGRMGFVQAGQSDHYYLDLALQEVPLDDVLMKSR